MPKSKGNKIRGAGTRGKGGKFTSGKSGKNSSKKK